MPEDKVRKSFVLHVDALEVLSELSDEQAGQLIKAIYSYHAGDDFELSGLLKAVFIPFKNQFQRDLEKYKEICERNKNNGKRGGRPRKPTETHGNPKNPDGFSENPDEPKKPDNDSDSDSDNGSDINIPPTPQGAEKPKTKKGTRIPENWKLDQDCTNYALKKGYSFSQVGELAEDFRLYWQNVPGAKGLKLSWATAWQSWVRKDIEYKGDPNSRNKQNGNRSGGRQPADHMMIDGEVL